MHLQYLLVKTKYIYILPLRTSMTMWSDIEFLLFWITNILRSKYRGFAPVYQKSFWFLRSKLEKFFPGFLSSYCSSSTLTLTLTLTTTLTLTLTLTTWELLFLSISFSGFFNVVISMSNEDKVRTCWLKVRTFNI